jgi:hypothetical protein
MLPVAVHLPLAGLNSSALLRAPLLLEPPITSTCPFASRIAVWPSRGVVILPVFTHVPGVCDAVPDVRDAVAEDANSNTPAAANKTFTRKGWPARSRDANISTS